MFTDNKKKKFVEITISEVGDIGGDILTGIRLPEERLGRFIEDFEYLAERHHHGHTFAQLAEMSDSEISLMDDMEDLMGY